MNQFNIGFFRRRIDPEEKEIVLGERETKEKQNNQKFVKIGNERKKVNRKIKRFDVSLMSSRLI